MSDNDEKLSSFIAIWRSSTVFDYKEDAKEEAETRNLKGNQYMTSGKKDNNIVKKTVQLEVRNKSLRDTRLKLPYHV